MFEHVPRLTLQEAVSAFVSELKQQGVFAKEVRSAGVAFHSYYMASIAPALLAALKKVRSAARPIHAWSCQRARCQHWQHHSH